jgi:HSP20 family molecular chaperone IbpA
MTGMARVYVERRELPDELRRVLEAQAAAVEFTPPLDVIESDTSVQLLLDLPGVSREHIEIVFSGNVVLISGEKSTVAPDHGDAAFHIAERVRTIRARSLGRLRRRQGGRHPEGRRVARRAAARAERRGERIRIPIT